MSKRDTPDRARGSGFPLFEISGSICGGFALGIAASTAADLLADRPVPCLVGRDCTTVHLLPEAWILGEPLSLWGAGGLVVATLAAAFPRSRRIGMALFALIGLGSLFMQVLVRARHDVTCVTCVVFCLLSLGAASSLFLSLPGFRFRGIEWLAATGLMTGLLLVARESVPIPIVTPRHSYTAASLARIADGANGRGRERFLLVGSPACPACLKELAHQEGHGWNRNFGVRFFDVNGSKSAVELEIWVRLNRRHGLPIYDRLVALRNEEQRLRFAKTQAHPYVSEYESVRREVTREAELGSAARLVATPTFLRVEDDGSVKEIGALP